MLKYRQDLRIQNDSILPLIKDVVQNTLGERRYELTNHLGNVQAVVTDRTTWNATDVNFEAVVVMTSDYYPFGMQMPGRHEQYGPDGEYRYAYNGMEVDNEVSGNGNSYTTEFRQYDPRLGRWKSLDPLMASCASWSPYNAFENNPIIYDDPLGLSVEGDGVKKMAAKEGMKAAEKLTKKHGAIGKAQTAMENHGINVLPEVEVVAHGKNAIRITLQETVTYTQKPQTFWQWILGFEGKLKGNSTWKFGIEIKTHDGKWNGNTANPVKLKDADKVITLYWDDIEDLTAALKALDKELPKEFKNSPEYSGPKTFMEEAKKWIGPADENTYKPNKQQEGKTWDAKNNPTIKKKTSKEIMVRVWQNTNSSGTIKGATTKGPYPNEKELKQAHPNAEWNPDEGVWEAGAIPKR